MAKVDRLIGRSELWLAVCEYRVTRSKTSNSCCICIATLDISCKVDGGLVIMFIPQE